MPADRRRRRTLLAALVLVSLLLITLDFRQGDTGMLAFVQQRAMAAFSPVQNALAGVVRPIGGFFASLGELGRLREENLRLESELQALRERHVSLADLERENAQLREQLGMAQRYDFTTSATRVIAQPPGAFRWSVLVDVGLEHGVREGMAVINAEGLVGKVTQAGTRYARVQLAASPNARYSVRIADTGQQGLLSGRGARPLELRVIDDPDSDIPAGAEVVTRAFQGTSIPDGIPIGVIEDAGSGVVERAQQVGVMPHVDWNRLDVVLVVLDAPEVPSDSELDLPDADADPDEDATDEQETARSGRSTGSRDREPA